MSDAYRIEPTTVETGRIALSGLAARPNLGGAKGQGSAKGLILALHGGNYSAGYWNFQGRRGESLLALGAALGFHTLAVDRPGYGLSHDHPPERLGLESQVGLLFDIIDAARERLGFDGPAFVIGHSIGGILALMMAAHPRGAALAGIDVLGVPFRFPESEAGDEVNSWTTEGTHVPYPDEEARRWLLFGPDGTFDADAFAYDSTLPRPMPVAEYRDALAMPAVWPRLLPTIRIPVQFTLAEHEVMQATGWDTLREVEALLTGSRHAVVRLQRSSGHNVSVHHIARAYHLRAIAFFEECAASSPADAGERLQ